MKLLAQVSDLYNNLLLVQTRIMIDRVQMFIYLVCCKIIAVTSSSSGDDIPSMMSHLEVSHLKVSHLQVSHP